MNESSVLSEIIALFDSAEGKVCPVLGTDSLLTPAAFVRVISLERNAFGDTIKVIFELRYRYREADPSDGTRAFSYLEHLTSVAEATGLAEILSVEGGGTAKNGSVAECCARMCYYPDGVKTFSIISDLGDLACYVKKLTLKDGGIIRSRQYIYDASVVRDRVGGDCRLSLECSGDGLAYIRGLFGGAGAVITVLLGDISLRGEFILAEITASDSLCCELLSTGKTEYGSYDFESGSFVPDTERSNV